jgi:hypothetical protein
MHRDETRSGVPIIVHDRGATTAPAFPGAMIAPADGTRTHLIIQAAGFYQLTIYPRSGSDPTTEVGITILGPSGVVEFTEREDAELVVAEWWAYCDTVLPPGVAVMEEIYR